MATFLHGLMVSNAILVEPFKRPVCHKTKLSGWAFSLMQRNLSRLQSIDESSISKATASIINSHIDKMCRDFQNQFSLLNLFYLLRASIFSRPVTVTLKVHSVAPTPMSIVLFQPVLKRFLRCCGCHLKQECYSEPT